MRILVRNLSITNNIKWKKCIVNTQVGWIGKFFRFPWTSRIWQRIHEHSIAILGYMTNCIFVKEKVWFQYKLQYTSIL